MSDHNKCTCPKCNTDFDLLEALTKANAQSHDNINKKPHFEQLLNLKFPFVDYSPKMLSFFNDKKYAAFPNSIFLKTSALAGYLDRYEHLRKSRRGLENADFQAVMGVFKQGGALIYKMAREFGEELFKTDIKLPIKYIPETKNIICIEFPEHLRFPLKDVPNAYFHCCYVWVENFKGLMHETETGKPIYKDIFILLPCFDSLGNINKENIINAIQLGSNSEDEMLEDVLNKYVYSPSSISNAAPDRWEVSSNERQNHRGIIEYILKCLLYIDSGEPDLRKYKAPKIKSENPKKIRRFLKTNEGVSLVDMVLVGFGHKKPIVYEGRTPRKGHWRWQPWGVQWSKIKLIWLEETTTKKRVSAIKE